MTALGAINSTTDIGLRSIRTVQYAAPTTGQTVTVDTTGSINVLINPAGTLATLTVALPGSPTNGDTVTISSSQIVTALTISGGTVIGILTTLAVGTFASYTFSTTASKWFRTG